MHLTRTNWRIVLVLLLAFWVSSCGAPTAEESSQTWPLASPLSTPTPRPTATSAPTATPTATPAPLLSPAQLVILHTNDNWGETEPCG